MSRCIYYYGTGNLIFSVLFSAHSSLSVSKNTSRSDLLYATKAYIDLKYFFVTYEKSLSLIATFLKETYNRCAYHAL